MAIRNTSDVVEEIIGGLSYLIMHNRAMLGHEQYHPSMNPDESDDAMERYQKHVKELRAIRERFETLMTGGLE